MFTLSSFTHILYDSGHFDAAVHRKLSRSKLGEDYKLTPYSLLHLIENEITFLHSYQIPKTDEMNANKRNRLFNKVLGTAKDIYGNANRDPDLRAWLERDELTLEQRRELAKSQIIKALENSYEVMFLKMLRIMPLNERAKILHIFTDIEASPMYSLARLGSIEHFEDVISVFSENILPTIINARNKNGLNALDGAIEAQSGPVILKILGLYSRAERLTILQRQKQGSWDDNTYLQKIIAIIDEHTFEGILNLLPLKEQKDELNTILIGKSLLYAAACNGNSDIVKKLLAEPSLHQYKQCINNDGPNYTILLGAASSGRVSLFKYILNQYPEHYRQTVIEEACNLLDPLLHNAAHSKSSRMVKYILSLIPATKQLDAINKVNTHQDTVLHVAACSKNFSMMKYIFNLVPAAELLDTIRKVNTQQETVLHVAVMNGDIKSIRKIIEIYCNSTMGDALFERDIHGRTFLHLVAGWHYNLKDIQNIKDLIDPAQLYRLLEEKDCNGDTPLHRASSATNLQFIHAFTSDYSDEMKLKLLWIVNNQNQSVLYRAIIETSSYRDDYFSTLISFLKLFSADMRFALIRDSYCIDDLLPDIIYKVINNKKMANNNNLIIKFIKRLFNLFHDNERIYLLRGNSERRGTFLHQVVSKLNKNTFDTILSLIPVTLHAKLMLIHNPWIGTVLHCAIQSNNIDIVNTILKRISDEEFESISERNYFFHTTIFHCAAASNNLDVLRLIFNKLSHAEKYRVLNIADDHNRTALKIAFIANNLSIINELLKILPENERLPILLAKDKYGRSQLSLLTFNSIGDIEKYILSLFPGSKLLSDYINNYHITDIQTVVNWIEGESDRLQVVFELFRNETDIYKLSDIYNVFVNNRNFYSYEPNFIAESILTRLLNNYMNYPQTIKNMKLHAQKKLKIFVNGYEFDKTLLLDILLQQPLFKNIHIEQIFGIKKASKKRSYANFFQSDEETPKIDDDILEPDNKRIKLPN